MKKFLLGAVSLIALGLVTPASAADLAARPYTKAPPLAAPLPPTWAGFYIGVQGGGGWGRSKETFFGAPNTAIFVGTQSYNTSGGFVGGVAGYNWQFGNYLIGIEGDYHWSDISGRSGVVNAGLGDTYFTKLRSFGDIKGRAGWANGPWLLFISGGAAVGDLQHRYDAALNGGAANSFSQNDWRWGWTVGAGGEYMFAPNWSAKLEYNFIDFGKSTIQYSPVPTNRSEWKDTVHTVKAGIIWHFNGPVIAKY
ncbi:MULTISPECIES: outer membrane protein [unclassified Bradyrhizobium]|uniref:outer membrane protein n=1 Tax=unclassified Bradyrhizobium TaxID=2631580 RepID=UPI0028E245D7|nr:MULTISPECIES: outer membrane beta-barrel protein [unclassified Bradyrhizobium]